MMVKEKIKVVHSDPARLPVCKAPPLTISFKRSTVHFSVIRQP